ncbi:MAG: hypothetical protein VX899_23970 [Myxococcota bacterium]|nr:hypothetical protein [Myxococcota bacterium]
MLSLFLLPLLAQDSPVAGLAMTDLIETLPACTPKTSAAPTLDLQKSCVAGACEGMSIQQLTEALGEPTCEGGKDTVTQGSTFCDWPGGISGHYREGETGPGSLFVEDPAHRSPEGYGVGSSLACFIQDYGDGASSVEVRVLDGRLYITSLRLKEPHISVSAGLDGVVTKIQLN